MVCPTNTSLCVRSKRARVYRHHAHTCFNMCAWCRHTRGCSGRTHVDVLSGHTSGVFIGKTSDFYISRASYPDVEFISYRQVSAYQNLPTYGLSSASEVHQRNPWILPILRMGRGQHIPCTVQLDAQSLNAPLLPVAKNSSYEAGRTKDKDHHDNDMSTTTHHTTRPTTNNARHTT